MYFTRMSVVASSFRRMYSFNLFTPLKGVDWMIPAAAGPEGTFKERSPAHPHLGGVDVKALRFMYWGNDGAAGVTLLDMNSSTFPINERRKRE